MKILYLTCRWLGEIFCCMRSSAGYQPQPHQGDTLLLLLGLSTEQSLRTGVWQDKWLVDHLYWHNITLNCHIIVFLTFSDKNTHFTHYDYAEKSWLPCHYAIISALCRWEFTYLCENRRRKNYRPEVMLKMRSHHWLRSNISKVFICWPGDLTSGPWSSIEKTGYLLFKSHFTSSFPSQSIILACTQVVGVVFKK